ncbi:hypothetical protein Plec18170_008003 [Paecilomyces lecythidis]
MVQLDVEGTLAELTLAEKIALTAGTDFWHTASVPRLKIPALRTSDGPNGVRGTRFFNGIPSACLPCATALGATWDVDLLEELGHLLGEEAKAKGAHVLLAPTINTQRSPLGGRGFESFSEDGVLSGTLAGHYCKGVQAEGIAATLKHYVCNDQEHERMAVNSIVTQRALREIYLLPFQQALRICQTACVMTAYNKVNGTHASENSALIEDILRREWGWKGLAMSDWFGTYSTSEAINAGLDLEMPGPTRWRGEILAHAVSSNKVAEHILDERVRNVLELVNWTDRSGIPEHAEEKKLDRPQDRALLRRAAAESAVLLKNDDQILPFDKTKPIAVIGPNSRLAAYCGGGSAALASYYAVTPIEGIRSESQADVHFSQGVYGHKQLPELGPRMKTPDGKASGFLFKVYNEPPGHPSRKAVDELHLVSSNGFLADYKNPKIESPTFYADMEGTYTPEEDGTYEFGVSVAGTGQLFIDEELVVDNTKNQHRGSAFFGSGTVEVKGTKHLKAGTTYKVLFQFGSAATSHLNPRGVVAFGPGGFRFGGCKVLREEESIAAAVDLASKTEQVVIFAGLSGEWETEGYDRDHMGLPPGSDRLISHVLKANPNTVVVIQSGTPVTMPWVNETKALLQAWYGGNEGGNGIADVLYGNVNPSGKLPLSFPVHLRDNPSYLNFRSERGRVLYGEDVYVGYRFYEKTRIQPLFSFGHGLSYTNFSLSALRVAVSPEKHHIQAGEDIKVSLVVSNTGPVAGAETVQLWVIPPTSSSINRPVRELKGFKKVFLKVGEWREVDIVVNKGVATSFWDETRNSWVSEKGDYELLITGTGRQDLRFPFQVAKTRWWSGL